MTDCFILCYRDLKEASESMDALIEYHNEHPIGVIHSIELAEARYKTYIIYPYWVGIIFDNDYLRMVDNWLCEHYISCDEMCAGSPRYWEFRNLADSLLVHKF